MIEGSTKVTMDIGGIKRLALMPQEAVPKLLKQWAARYRSFLQERFARFSKGGGDWPPLKPATVARRRKPAKRKSKRKRKAARASILRDRNLLYQALNPTYNGAPGAYESQDQFKITIGYGGPAKHTGGKGQLTIAEIAEIHDKGLGNCPVRKIIVPPDGTLIDAMLGDVERAVERSQR